MENIWLVPSYYKQFHCKCEKCRHTCCSGWQIPLNKKEYDRLMTMECSDELRHRLDVSFQMPDEIDEDRYRIIEHNYLGQCPLQKDGLCFLQCEKGESYIPSICRMYPRSLKKINNQLVGCCSSACERIVELLFDSSQFELVKEEYNLNPTLEYDDPSFNQLLKYIDILNNHKNIKESLNNICLDINKDDYLNDLKSNDVPMNMCFELLDKLFEDEILNNITDELIIRYKNNESQFITDRNSFEKRFPKWNIYFANMLCNSLLFNNFPNVDPRLDNKYSYKGLCASYGLMRLISIGYTATHNTDEDLVDCISSLYHLIDHTPFYYNANIIVRNAGLLLNL